MRKALLATPPHPHPDLFTMFTRWGSNVWLFLPFSPPHLIVPIYYYSEYFWCPTRARKSFVLSFSSLPEGRNRLVKIIKTRRTFSKARRYLHLWSVTSQRQMSERGILLAGFGLFFLYYYFFFFVLLLLAYSEDGEGLLCLVESEE